MVSKTVYFDSLPTWVTVPDQVPAIADPGASGRAPAGGTARWSGGGCCAGAAGDGCAAAGGNGCAGPGTSSGHLRSKSSAVKCCAPAVTIAAAMVAIKAAAQFRDAEIAREAVRDGYLPVARHRLAHEVAKRQGAVLKRVHYPIVQLRHDETRLVRLQRPICAVLPYIALRLSEKRVLDDDKGTIGKIVAQNYARLERVDLAIRNVEDHRFHIA